MIKSTALPRRRFLAVTGVVLAQAALATDPARAQLVPTARRPSKVGIAPGYIVSGRGEHSANPFFVPQGKPSNKHMPTPHPVHGSGVMEEDRP
jgi:hypothetical protein